MKMKLISPNLIFRGENSKKDKESQLETLALPFLEQVFSYLNKNVTDLLKETSKAACKSTSTPIDSSLKLGNTDECAAVDKEMYE